MHPTIAATVAEPKARAATPISKDLIVLRNVGVHVVKAPMPKPAINEEVMSILVLLDLIRLMLCVLLKVISLKDGLDSE
jgi:hypothetical protein